MPILWIQLVSSLMMWTVMLLVTILIYPQFNQVALADLASYSLSHSHRISYIVLPLMLVEAISLGLLWTHPEMRSLWLYLSTALLLSIWLLTFIWIVPVHTLLSQTPSTEAIQNLQGLNMLRMYLWSAKTLLIVLFFYVMITPTLTLKKTLNTPAESLVNSANSALLLLQKSYTISDILETVMQRFPDSDILLQTPSKAIVYTYTKYLRFPDVLHLSMTDSGTQLYSGSLIGRSDLGANRKRVDRIAKDLKR